MHEWQHLFQERSCRGQQCVPKKAEGEPDRKGGGSQTKNATEGRETGLLFCIDEQGLCNSLKIQTSVEG